LAAEGAAAVEVAGVVVVVAGLSAAEAAAHVPRQAGHRSVQESARAALVHPPVLVLPSAHDQAAGQISAVEERRTWEAAVG
jgi:hypothetical protein